MCSIPYWSIHIAPVPSWMEICLQPWKSAAVPVNIAEAVMGATCWWKANPGQGSALGENCSAQEGWVSFLRMGNSLNCIARISIRYAKDTPELQIIDRYIDR